MLKRYLQVQHDRTPVNPRHIPYTLKHQNLRPACKGTLGGVAWTAIEDSGSSRSSRLALWCDSILALGNMPSFTTAYTATSGGVAWVLSKDMMDHSMLQLGNGHSAAAAAAAAPTTPALLSSSSTCSLTSRETRGETQAAAVDKAEATAGVSSSSNSRSSTSSRYSSSSTSSICVLAPQVMSDVAHHTLKVQTAVIAPAAAVAAQPRTAVVPGAAMAAVAAACDKKGGLKKSKRGWKAVERCLKKAAAVAKELLLVCWSPECSVKE